MSRVLVALTALLLGVAASPATAALPRAPDAGAPAATAAAPATAYERIGGADRYGTAALVSRRTFAPGVAVAYVVTGLEYADALAAGPAAAREGGPVLLTDPDVLPASTAAELQRLPPSRIVVVGGTAAVSPAVESALNGYHGGDGVVRVSGEDRYATAAALSRVTAEAGVGTVYVASGAGFPDALTAGGAASARRATLLLVRPQSLPRPTADELARLRPGRIVVVGGTRAVSAAVAATLATYAPVQRLSGTDRFGTAAALAAATWPTGASNLLLASGENFPDAVVAGAVAGRFDAPILLTARAHVPWSAWQEARRLRAARGIVVGGPAVVPDARVATMRRGCHASVQVLAGSQQVFRTIPDAPGQVALTFDMGGRLDPALDILRFLAANDVCATIFPAGAMSRTPAGQQVLAFVREQRDLFEVGNHTMHHCDLVRGGGGSPTSAPCAGPRPSAAFLHRELSDAAAVIARSVGLDPAPYWRPPYGMYDTAVLDAAAAAGYTKTFLWSVDTVDWRPVSDGGPTAAQISSRVVSGATSGSIVLMHLGGWNTRAALTTMVPGLRARGLTPTTLSHMLR